MTDALKRGLFTLVADSVAQNGARVSNAGDMLTEAEGAQRALNGADDLLSGFGLNRLYANAVKTAIASDPFARLKASAPIDCRLFRWAAVPAVLHLLHAGRQALRGSTQAGRR